MVSLLAVKLPKKYSVSRQVELGDSHLLDEKLPGIGIVDASGECEHRIFRRSANVKVAVSGEYAVQFRMHPGGGLIAQKRDRRTSGWVGGPFLIFGYRFWLNPTVTYWQWFGIPAKQARYPHSALG